jgi:hypothetical protein
MSERSPEAVLWDFLRGAHMTQALAVAVELGLADALEGGARSADDLAAAAGVDADALQRLLRALASDGVFEEREPGVFANTPMSATLRGDGWPEFARLFGGVFYRAVDDLGGAVRTGAATFPVAFGSDFWSWLAAHGEDRAAFDAAMAGGKGRTADRLAELEWRVGETVVDIGGGNGALLRALLARRAGVRGIVFDLPETERDESAFGEDLEFVAGSFFERVPAGDAYVLSGILHDWNDERAAAILRTIHDAAPGDARLLVLESVIPPGNEPDGAKWLDLLMLILSGGRERTEPEWRALLTGSGWTPASIEDGLIQAHLG